MTSSFTLFRFRGIDVGAHWTWLIMFALFVSQLATGFFPDAYPDLTDGAYWAMGLVTMVLFFISLLLHELGHAVRAQHEGMEIEGITLWIFGGVARFKGMFPSAGAEFRIAIAGPLVTVVLIGVFLGAWFAADAVGAPSQITGVFDYLWFTNLILLGFNMLPALPLDGGRVLRSSLWMRNKNFTQATVTAGRVARVISGGVMAFGAYMFLSGNGSGLMLVILGWFVLQAAQAEVGYAMFRQSLRGMSVGDVMSPEPEVVDPDLSIATFVDEFAQTARHSTYPVVTFDGDLLGLISLRQAADVPLAQRGLTRVRDVMVPREQLPVVDPSDEVPQAVVSMQEGPGRAIVLDDDRLVGILSMADVARALEIESIKTGPGERRRRPSRVWLLVIGGLLILGYLWSPPYVTVVPGTAFDVTDDIRIKGIKVDDVDGEYLLTSVGIQQPNVYGLASAMLRGKQIQPLAAFLPPDEDPDAYFEEQERVFKEAQTIATAAAAEAAGMKVKLTGKGALIVQVSEGSPASEVLEADDVVTAIDGKRITLADELSRAIRSRPAGSEFEFAIKRGKEKRTVTVESKEGIVPGAPGIGVLVSTEDFDVDLPFDITFKEREIGGPSAGLAYALAVYDLIEDADLSKGRIVATTGTMDLEGGVGPIGGVEEKTEAAEGQNAVLFLVPEGEVNLVPRTEMKVVGVGTLKQAIEALKR